MTLRRGRCLCGGVTAAIPAERNTVGVCHCETCRRWCSGPWMAIQAPDAIVEGETLRIYRSSRYAERGFCDVCGACIFHRPQDGPELAISAGLFDPEGLTLTHELFPERKAAFYRFGGDIARIGGLRMAAAWLPRILWRRLTRRGDR